ncbi:MAG: Clp protease N-terminal domain-containing protein [Pseudonocardiaceae bacterium]
MDILGIPAARLEATLLTDLDNFAAAAVAAVEAGSSPIEPSHVLIALARIPGGRVSSLFAKSHIPVSVFVNALRREAGPDPAGLVTAFTR